MLIRKQFVNVTFLCFLMPMFFACSQAPSSSTKKQTSTQKEEVIETTVEKVNTCPEDRFGHGITTCGYGKCGHGTYCSDPGDTTTTSDEEVAEEDHTCTGGCLDDKNCIPGMKCIKCKGQKVGTCRDCHEKASDVCK